MLKHKSEQIGTHDHYWPLVEYSQDTHIAITNDSALLGQHTGQFGSARVPGV